MTVFPITPRPASSPWGAVQHAVMLAPGIWQVMTAGHGGILLSEDRQAAMPEALAIQGCAYEEDCDWALVVLGFEAVLSSNGAFSPGEILLAHDTVKCWHPDRYTAFTGKAVPENDSHVLKKQRAYLDAVGKHCVTSAWGSWAEWVPEGKTGIVARKVVSVDHLGYATYADEELCALVNADDYAARGEVFALEDHPHEIIPFPQEVRPKQVAL